MSKYKLKLYIIGVSAISLKAVNNLKKICQSSELKDRYEPEIIDLLKDPSVTESEKIVATPLLVKELPEPMRRVIGDLSDHKKVLLGLGLYEIS